MNLCEGVSFLSSHVEVVLDSLIGQEVLGTTEFTLTSVLKPTCQVLTEKASDYRPVVGLYIIHLEGKQLRTIESLLEYWLITTQRVVLYHLRTLVVHETLKVIDREVCVVQVEELLLRVIKQELVSVLSQRHIKRTEFVQVLFVI